MLSCRREKGGTVMDLAMPAAAAAALDALERRGYESYVVGGCVRDALLGREPHDWDICTAAPPEAVEAVFAGSRVLETGRKHGTVTLLTEDGPLEAEVPELTRMMLEEIRVWSPTELEVAFLDGSRKKIRL